jgi:uncharacterized Zn-binding protein involved in type VI secretion
MPAFESVDGDLVGGGTVIATTVFTTSYGKKIARHGDAVTPHGIGPHAAATLIASQTQYVVEGKAVCRIGDSATCGDTISPSGGNLLTVLVGP